MISRSVKLLCINVVMSVAFYRILASALLSIKVRSSSKMRWMFVISSKLLAIMDIFVRRRCSSVLNFFSNSPFSSSFFSSSFLYKSAKPLSIFLSCCYFSRESSSRVWSKSLLFSSFRRLAFKIIFCRSSTFCFKLVAMSSIYTSSCPLCSSKIHLAHTVSEHVLQKYSTFFSKCLVQLVNIPPPGPSSSRMN